MSKDEKDLELFRAAFEQLDDATLYEGKFGTPKDLDSPHLTPHEEDIEIVQEVRDHRLMEDTFGFVEKSDHSKYWVPGEEGEKDLFSTLLTEESQAPRPAVQDPPKPKTKWDSFAATSTDAKVIDLRAYSGSSAVRELSHSIYAKGVFRIVYEESEKKDTHEEGVKIQLEAFLKQEKYSFAFSPDSKEKSGLIVLKT